MVAGRDKRDEVSQEETPLRRRNAVSETHHGIPDLLSLLQFLQTLTKKNFFITVTFVINLNLR